MPPVTSALLARLAGILATPGPGVTVEKTRTLAASPLSGHRTVTVCLPPNYEDTPGRSWPLLIAHDGQDLAAWKLTEALAQHHAAGGDTPVVVAIDAGPDRLADYGTAGQPNAQGCGAHAAEFQAFVTDTVLPFVQRRYRVRRDPVHTAVMGASLGGLSAFDLAWHRPDLFGAAGVFSGSFWWRTSDANLAEKQSTRIAHQRVRATARAPRLRLWFEAGTRDETSDRDGNGVIDAIQDTTELIDDIAARGLPRGPDLVYHEIPGGEHHPSTWALALPDFLHWAFPARPVSPHEKN